MAPCVDLIRSAPDTGALKDVSPVPNRQWRGLSLFFICHPSQTKAGVTFLQFAFGCRLVDFGTSLHLLQYEYYDCHTLGVAST